MPKKSKYGFEVYRQRPMDAPPLPPLPPKGPKATKATKKKTPKTFVRGRAHSFLRNFQCVRFGRVYRSAAPGYMGGDAVQELEEKTLYFLKTNAFKRVVSLNERKMATSSQADLKKNGITYLHLPTKDFEGVTANDLEAGVKAIESGKTLVYCGFGQGRTGCLISAWAAVHLWKQKPNYFHQFSMEDIRKFIEHFGVEKSWQVEDVFRWLWERIALYKSNQILEAVEEAMETETVGSVAPPNVLPKSSFYAQKYTGGSDNGMP